MLGRYGVSIRIRGASLLPPSRQGLNRGLRHPIRASIEKKESSVTSENHKKMVSPNSWTRGPHVLEDRGLQASSCSLALPIRPARPLSSGSHRKTHGGGSVRRGRPPRVRCAWRHSCGGAARGTCAGISIFWAVAAGPREARGAMRMDARCAGSAWGRLAPLAAAQLGAGGPGGCQPRDLSLITASWAAPATGRRLPPSGPRPPPTPLVSSPPRTPLTPPARPLPQQHGRQHVQGRHARPRVA